MTGRPGTYAHRLTDALEFPVGSPLCLLATAVISVAVDDAREGYEVLIEQRWLDIADVDPKLLKDEGVMIDPRTRLELVAA